jgi:hypothetical protein
MEEKTFYGISSLEEVISFIRENECPSMYHVFFRSKKFIFIVVDDVYEDEISILLKHNPVKNWNECNGARVLEVEENEYFVSIGKYIYQISKRNRV